MPRGPRAPYFEGSNIIEFLERYKELYEDYNLRPTDILKRVPRYYKTTISLFVKNIPEYTG